MKVELTEQASYLANYFGFELSQLQVVCRKKNIVIPRQKIMAYMYSVKSYSVRNEDISAIFNQNHATVNHAVKCIENDCFTSLEFKHNWNKFVEYGNKFKPEIKPEIPIELEPEFIDKHSL